jgi:flavorubredoxin
MTTGRGGTHAGAMKTNVHEIADGVYRLSTWVPDVAPDGFTFNQFLIDADEPLLHHCGPRSLFDSVSAAAGSVVAPERLRWITFGHVEADECGSMNQWLAAAPHAEIVYGALGCQVSLNDIADRPPRPVADGEVLDLGSHRLRVIATAHVPHGWEAQILYDETTSTLLCGDLFTQTGDRPALVHDVDIVAAALAAEDVFHATCLTATTATTIRALADLAPRTLALMHGPAFAGDCVAALDALSYGYQDLFAASLDAVVAR